MSEGERSIQDYAGLEVKKTSEFRDQVALDVNGTTLILKQNMDLPVIVEIFIEDEENPIGAFSIGNSETLTLGGLDEDLTRNIELEREKVENIRSSLDDMVENLKDLERRFNPPGKSDLE